MPESVNYNSYLGPWVWDDSGDEGGPPYWRAPVGTVGLVELRPTQQQALVGVEGDRNCAFFTVDGTLDSDIYDLIGTEDARTDPLTAAVKSTWLAKTGYEPKGDTLADALLDQLTDGSDPIGESAVMTLMPTVQGNLDLHMGGYSLIGQRKLNYNSRRLEDRPYLDRLNTAIHAAYQKHHDAEIRGEMREGHPRRVYDYWIDKFNLDRRDKASIQRLLPPGLRQGHPGPLEHETIVKDNFNRPDEADFDGSTSSEGFTWDVFEGDAQLLGNLVAHKSSDLTIMRAEIDLSSSDHYSQQLVTGIQLANFQIITARVALVDSTQYQGTIRNSPTGTFVIQKLVEGTQTNLISQNDTTPSRPFTGRLECNGSSLTLSINGTPQLSTTHTDTAIDSNLRCGISWFATATNACDDFEAADLEVGVTPTRYYHHMMTGAR